MRFDEQTLLQRCSLSQKRVAKLRTRQLGGTSGALGYEYQHRYALLRTVELCIAGHDALVSMEALCPVDDVVIENGVEHEHAQCKISPQTSWLAENKKIRKEFSEQSALFRKVGVTGYRLLLVVADEDAGVRLRGNARKKKHLPVGVARRTEVVHFPHPDPAHQAWRVPRVAAALDRLLPPAARDWSNRERLYKELSHALRSASGWPSTPQPVRALLLACAANAQGLPVTIPEAVRPPQSVSRSEWDVATAELAEVPGLSITTEGGVCCYTNGLESGVIARCDTERFRRFVRDVIARRPRTMEDFLEVRPVPV